MNKVTIYHNPRCSKSRSTKAILDEQGVNVNVIEYLKQTPAIGELKEILEMLKMQPRDLMRKGEAAYTENNLDDASLSNEQLMQAMIDNPILIERPIVVSNGKAIIGRPPSSVLDIL